MSYDFDNIAHQLFEELETPFGNYLRRNFTLTEDEIHDIYTEVWIAVRQNICEGRVEAHTNWRAYIFRIGWNRACNVATRRNRNIIGSLDDEQFNDEDFQKRLNDEREAEKSIYNDPDLRAVLAAELSYIPDPCNSVLKMYYYDGFGMKEIADAMNYSGPNSAKTVKNRCLERIRERVLNAVRRLGILDD